MQWGSEVLSYNMGAQPFYDIGPHVDK